VVIQQDLVYKNSVLDGFDAAPGAVSEGARAWRAAMLPEFVGSHFNYITGYDKGINALLLDFSGLPPAPEGGAELLTPADFEFRVGAGGDPTTGAAAPAPTGFAVHRGAGMHESDRVAVTWPDRAMTTTWIEVTARATPNTGLAEPHVFYFGNLVGDTGSGARADPNDLTQPLRVDGADLAAVRRHFGAVGEFDYYSNPHDHNRDMAVNALDLLVTLRNAGRSLRPVSAAPPPAEAPAASSTTAERRPHRPSRITRALFAESPILH
jgi:hypothetical protein